MKINTILSIFSFIIILSACGSKEDLVIDEPKIEEIADAEDIDAVMCDGFYPGDEVTRTSLIYGQNGLSFSWKSDDKFGVFPTSSGELRTENEHASQAKFYCSKIVNGGMTAEIKTDDTGFSFSNNFNFTAYTPYISSNDQNFKQIPFNFSNQVQQGLVDMAAYHTGGYNNAAYKESERIACLHLSENDVMISPEMTPENQAIRFRMRHVGSIARFYVLFPKGKILKIKDIKLIADKPIFYEGGYINLSSHPFEPSKEPSTAIPALNSTPNNWGVDLKPYPGESQITPNEGTKTNCLTLKFGTNKDNPEGIYNNWQSNDDYANYLMAYLMMYPINYDSNTASAYLYVTADDENGNEVHFRTTKLSSKYMCSGYVYQWTKNQTEDTPIELTATLLPWQDIVADGINTDLEK